MKPGLAPVAWIENGTRPEQRVVTGTLDALAAITREASIRSPALLVVGETAALAGSLGWFGATAAPGANGAVQAVAAA